jgi:predicted MPP superfamily phosphohydrolase
MKKYLIIPDTHCPYHDKKAWNLMIKVAKDLKPDGIIIQGDFADFYSVSSHSKSPDRVNNLKWEVKEVKKLLKQLDSLGAKDKIFISGNHEDRLRRYLEDKAPELFGIVDIPELLELKQNKWKYVSYKGDIKVGKLNATHDVNSSGRNAVFDAINTYQGNTITGHSHRICMIVEGNAQGQAHVGASFGWLGDFKAVDYMHRVKVARSWNHGFGIMYLEPNGDFHLTPVVIFNNKCAFNGKIYR